jgi:hypothetical protein
MNNAHKFLTVFALVALSALTLASPALLSMAAVETKSLSQQMRW